MRTFRLFAIFAAIAVMTGACSYKDLVEDDEGARRKLRIHYVWDNVDSIPQTMRLVFYPDDRNIYTRGFTVFDILSKDTTIELHTGRYGVTVWNTDFEHVITAGYTRQEEIYATTGNYSPHGDVTMPKVLDSLYNSQKVLDYPDYMVHATEMEVSLPDNDEDHVLTLEPDSMVVTVDVIIHGIKGLEYCTNIRGAINNIPAKRLITHENTTQEPVSVMFDGKKDYAADSTVQARFYLFGMEPSEQKRMSHKMVVFFWLTAGQVFMPVDVSKLVWATRPDDKYVLIELDADLDLRDFLKGTPGMVVDAEDWEDTEEIQISF